MNATDTSAQDMVLVVDLDGTLLRSDMLLESFWSAFSREWRAPFIAGKALVQGRAELKKCLAGISDLDVATLPCDTDVIAYVTKWRVSGKRVALVTASDSALAERIGTHLGLFDEVHGSDGQHNLKGPEKARFLIARFGESEFEYMGDSHVDLPVWKVAAKAITVNASAGLRRKVDALGGASEHLAAKPATITAYLQALRPHHWLKNLLVFVPMMAAHQFDLATFVQSALAFIVFSLIASAVYVLNDQLDLRADRDHPRKCERPFASGRVPLKHGAFMLLSLLLAGILIAVPLGRDIVFVVLGYLALSTAYSLWVKRYVVFDIVALACLHTLRLFAGSAATGIELSIWLMVFSIFLFLSLACVKRQAELIDVAAREHCRISGRGYKIEHLPIITRVAYVSGFVAALVLWLYVNSPQVQAHYSQPLALGGICVVLLYWISYMIKLTRRGQMNDDPVVFAATDRHSQICIGCMICLTVLGVVA